LLGKIQALHAGCWQMFFARLFVQPWILGCLAGPRWVPQQVPRCALGNKFRGRAAKGYAEGTKRESAQKFRHVFSPSVAAF